MWEDRGHVTGMASPHTARSRPQRVFLLELIGLLHLTVSPGGGLCLPGSLFSPRPLGESGLTWYDFEGLRRIGKDVLNEFLLRSIIATTINKFPFPVAFTVEVHRCTHMCARTHTEQR